MESLSTTPMAASSSRMRSDFLEVLRLAGRIARRRSGCRPCVRRRAPTRGRATRERRGAKPKAQRGRRKRAVAARTRERCSSAIACGVFRSSASARERPAPIRSAFAGETDRRPAIQDLLALLETTQRPVDRLPVMRCAACSGAPPRPASPPAAHGSSRSCRATSTSSRLRPAGSRCASSNSPSRGMPNAQRDCAISFS